MHTSVLYFLIGYPGVGKHTVATAMVEQSRDAERHVLVDNHYINNPIFGLVDVDGIKPVPTAVWAQVRKVREAVFDTMRELSPAGWNFIITNYLADDPSEQRGFDEVAALAEARNAHFLPVILRCDQEEHLRRFTDPRRAARLKWRDANGLRRVMNNRGHLAPEHPNLIELDVTELSADAAALTILTRGRSLQVATH